MTDGNSQFSKMIYQQLEASNFDQLQPGENITAKRLDLLNRDAMEIYIFKDLAGCACCALQVEKKVEELPRLNGISIFNELLSKKNEVPRLFVVLKCNIQSTIDQFANILKEIIEDFDNSNREIEFSLSRVLSKWRYYFAEPKMGYLREEEICGLLGELIILNKLMHNLGFEVLNFWTPDRGDEDFVFDGSILEVKTSIKEKHEHVINGIDQLKMTETTKYVCSILIFASAEASFISLPLLVSSILEILQVDLERKEIFLSKLKERGYDVRDESFYEKYKFKILKSAIFKIDHDFPKLTTDELKSPLSSRISKVRYTIDMEGLPSVPLDDFKLATLVSGRF